MSEVLAILSVYGLSILVSEYDGPFNVLRRVRKLMTVLGCAVCASVWLSIPISMLFAVGVVGYFAVLGGAILLIRIDEALI